MRRVAAAGIVGLWLVALAGLGVVLLGGRETGHEARSALDDALGYLPRDVPLAIAIETGGPQSEAAGELLYRVPVVGGRLYQWMSEKLGWAFIRFERDIRPLLGDELVVGVVRPRAALRAEGILGRLPALVVAWRVRDPEAAKRVIVRSPDVRAGGRAAGVRLWENQLGTGWFAVDGDVFVAAGSRRRLEDAIRRRRAPDRLDEGDFAAAVAGLPRQALVRAMVRPRAVMADFPALRGALVQRWIAALGTAGATVSVRGDGLALDLRARTRAGDLTAADPPVAATGAPAPVRRGTEMGAAVAEPARVLGFAEQLVRAVDPLRWTVWDRARRRVRERTGVDVTRDLVGRMRTAAVALSADRTDVALRARLTAPEAFAGDLRRAAPVLADLAATAVPGATVAPPSAGERFYALRVPGHEPVVFGPVGGLLVAADAPARAAGLVAEPGRAIAGARGGLVFTADAADLLERLARRRVAGPARLGLPVALRPLGDLSGWVAADRAGLRAQALLAID